MKNLLQRHSRLSHVALVAALTGTLMGAPSPIAASFPGGDSASLELQVNGPYATVTGNGANLWSGPGMGFWTIGLLHHNETIPVIGISADRQWWEVNTRIGPAFIPATDVAVTGGDSVPTANIGVIGTITVVNAQVHDGPGINATVVALITHGSQFFVLSTRPDGSWLYVRYRFGKGWLSSTVTNLDNGAAVTAGAAAAQGPRVIINTAALNVRSGPGYNYKTIGVLQGGAVAAIVGRNTAGTWLQINTSFGTGWVNIAYVITKDFFGSAPVTEAQFTNAPMTAPTFLVLTGRVNVRTGPNIAFPSIGSITAGTKLPIIGQSKDKAWWLVTTPVGQGWMNKQLGQGLGSNLTAVPVVN